MRLNIAKLLIATIVFAFFTVSCSDQLEYREHQNYGKDYVQLNFSNIGGLVSDIYSRLDYDFGNYDQAMLASASDEAEYAWSSNKIHDFYNGAWSPSNPMSSTWNSSYTAIQGCNLFLEEFLGLTFPELSFNDDYAAQMFRYNNYENEVRFLRAYFYFNLIRQYGDVPFFTHVISTEEINSLHRRPFAEIVEFIVDECDAIVNKIPVDYTNLGSVAIPGNPENGRANRLAVLALKARTLLFAASPLFNTDNSKELWKEATMANKAVLDSCSKYGYVLGNYTDIWGAENWQSKEAIFVRRLPDTGGTNVLEQRNFPVGVEGGNSGNCPTQTLVDAYQMKATGKFWNEDGSGFDPANPYEGRDPRFEMSIVKNGDTRWPSYNTRPIQTYVGGANGAPIAGATPTGYYLRKLLDSSIDLRPGTTTRSRHSWITFRLGEFYLNYAEAVFNYLGSADATSAEFPLSAREAVNVVRNRQGVQMPPLETGLAPDDFWKRYSNERMVELAFEGHRFWDVRRWKEGEKFKSIDRMRITRNADGSYTYTRSTQNRIWDNKMYLFPIPQAERLKNPNLTQNPGY
ncbi:RagB/SusD family nutrient uptake outer membrane protein [Proteiniphilum sp. X52]|uniref:RagB/SusD family nutrient uptake outer membrane protein n=1 Tax=Proteiniphilum sp. X52 TaxID=2382159 RepID=UPI000F09CFED|nr:RagB/SusD family nutrient uptake outer membrane protein [Proteiniphilum sp. X52]RNC65958.1 RagB/SusD family nutrient uptake outer membrane protein [Proteiniphilum sp. X52]